MYCNCGSIDRARELFNQLLPVVDHITYSTLMKAYLSINQPLQVLNLFKQLQSSPSISPDTILYLNLINACKQLGLRYQAEMIHRLIPSNIIEKNLTLQSHLIDMHAHCLHLNEADRLFSLLKQRDNLSLGNLIHGYAINGQGEKVFKLCQEIQSELKFNEQVYKMILYACAFTGGLVNQAREVYQTIPEKFKTPEIAAAMVKICFFLILININLFCLGFNSCSCFAV
jgi:pentatricopeptide repeat protein